MAPPLITALFLDVGGVLLTIYAVRSASSRAIGQHEKGSPLDMLDILKNRYAKGEISKNGYDRMKDDIAGP